MAAYAVAGRWKVLRLQAVCQDIFNSQTMKRKSHLRQAEMEVDEWARCDGGSRTQDASRLWVTSSIGRMIQGGQCTTIAYRLESCIVLEIKIEHIFLHSAESSCCLLLRTVVL